MREKLESLFDFNAYNIYGLTEIGGSGVAFECPSKCGMHINEDHVIAEIVDPETGEVLPYGESGELVFTTITKTGMPMIRYRTHDICSLDVTPCSCGRMHVRMSRIAGRTDEIFSDTVADIEKIQRKIADQIKSVVGIAAMVKLVPPKTIPRSEGKAKRIIDNHGLTK